MKKRKFSWLLNIICIALCIGGISYGVFSAKNANLTIGGTIGFYAHADVFVECKIENARLTDSSSLNGNTYYLTKDNEISTTQQSINLGKVAPTLDISKITFAKDSTTKQILPLKFTFTMTTDSSFTIAADLNIDNVNFNNVKYEWGDAGALQIIRPQGASSVDDDSVVGTGAIELTMSVEDETETAEEAIKGNMLLVISAAKNETDADFTLDESGNLTQVPAGSGEITLPAYIYTSDTYTKVKQLGYKSGIYNYKIENISTYSSIKIANGISNINAKAFANSTGLTSITIPSTVTSIGSEALSSCSSLASITVGSGNSVYDSRDNCNAIIETATNTLITGSSGTTTIPSSVTSIGASAFESCSGLTSITIPNSVTSIGSSAFAYCKNLSSITVESENSVYDSRNNCDAIIETATNTLIAGSSGTTGIPSTVTSIGPYAFQGSGITGITIPNTITSLGEYAFSSSNLSKVTFEDNCKLTEIPQYAFSGTELTIVDIPEGVKTIGDYAFRGSYVLFQWIGGCVLRGLVKVTLPSTLTSIGTQAFWSDQLFEIVNHSTSLTLTSGSTNNGYIAYVAKNIITDANDSKVIDESGYISYKDDTSKILLGYSGDLAQLGENFPSDIDEICKGVFGGRNFPSGKFTIPASIKTIGNYAFYNCTGLKSLDFSKATSLTKIGDYAFYMEYGSNGSLGGEIIIPASVTNIGKYVFYGTKITKVTINSGKFDDKAFYYCEYLTEVELKEGVTRMGCNAFGSCSKLSKITIPVSLTIVDTDPGGNNDRTGPFNNCTSLKSINYNGTKENWESCALKTVIDSYHKNKFTIICSDGSISPTTT